MVSPGALWPSPGFTRVTCRKDFKRIVRNEMFSFGSLVGQPVSTTTCKPSQVLTLATLRISRSSSGRFIHPNEIADRVGCLGVRARARQLTSTRRDGISVPKPKRRHHLEG